MVWTALYQSWTLVPARLLAGTERSVEGIVTDWPRPSVSGTALTVHLRAGAGPALGAVLYAPEEYGDLRPGDRIAGDAVLRLADTRGGEEMCIRDRAMTMGDRIVVMNHGEVQQIGTPYEIFNHPANLFVASFIGAPSMNLFDVTVEKTDQGWQAGFSEDYAVPLTGALAERAEQEFTSGASAILGCRPEHTRLLEMGNDGLQVPVLLQEVVGSETILRGEFHGRKLAVTTAYSGQASPEQMCLCLLYTSHLY